MGPTVEAPSGEQIEIAFGDQAVTIVGVGGGLRTYTIGGRHILDGYADDELCTSGRGQVLIPWPNRIKDGSYEFQGGRHQLELSERANHNAIHGLVRWATWTPTTRKPHRVVMEYTLHPRPGFPFALDLAIEYSLSEAGLHVRTTATNAGAEPCPYGAGAHPYLAVPSVNINDCILELPANVVLESDNRGIPLSSQRVDGTKYDFRSARPIGVTRLDHCFTDLERDPHRMASVHLSDPSAGVSTTLWMDQSYQYLMVFTGDPLPDVNRRSLAVEPMTCAPNAFRSGDGLIVLQPGQRTTATWGISPKGHAPSNG